MTPRLRALLVVAAIVLAAGIMVVALSNRAARGGQPWTFEVEMKPSAGTVAQLFWTAESNFVVERSLLLPIRPGVMQTLRFRVPRGVHSLRFDPADAAGEVVIGPMALRASDGRTLATFGRGDLTAPHNASITARDGAAVLLANDNDPWVIISIGCIDGAPSRGPGGFTGASLVVASLLTALLVGACGWIVARDFARGLRATGARHPVFARALVWPPIVFLLVFAAKLLLIRQFPVMVPFWDQWDGEALAIYVPYYNCGLSWSQMFALHNEHRIFFPRLLALGLLTLNGQWDPRLQQVVNAALHASTAALLFAIVWRALDFRRPELLLLVLVPVFGLPHSAENTLMGFQSAFYFFVLFSVLGLWLTTAFRPGSGAWSLGCLCAICGLFTAAGGVVLPLVIGVVALITAITAPRAWRDVLLTLAAAAAIFALGLFTAAPPLAHHEPLKAKTLEVFFGSFLRNLAWPWIDTPGMSVLMWLPVAGLVVAVARRRGRTTLAERLVLGLAAWVTIQAAAIAYGRGGAWLVPAGRYQDFLSLGFVANTLVLMLAMWSVPPGTPRRFLALAAVVWAGAASFGLDAAASQSMVSLNWSRPHWQAQAVNVRRFVQTGDVAELKSRPGHELPYPVADSLIDVLQRPIIRRILPAAVRPPLRIEPRVITGNAFVPQGTYPTTPHHPGFNGWGSFTGEGNAARGTFESTPIEACPVETSLTVPVSGYLRVEGLSLSLREIDSGRTTPIWPSYVARESWIGVTVPCPQAPFVVVAADERPDFWLAFREPIETGWASERAEWLIAAAARVMALAVVATLLAARYA